MTKVVKVLLLVIWYPVLFKSVYDGEVFFIQKQSKLGSKQYHSFDQ